VDLTFLWFADAGAWPERPGGAAASLDQAVVGPNALLDHVETMLGLGRPAVANVKRIAVYRQKIEASGGPRFWSESFALDPWSSSRELLRWRDELIEAGWRPGVGAARRRLADLAAAETSGPALPLGRADRLRAAVAALDAGASVGLCSVMLVDSRETLPAGWRALLDALERRGVRIEQIAKPTPAAAAGADLRRVAAGGRDWPVRRDGSLTLLTADTELTASEALAAWLAADAEANAAVTFVTGDDTTLLDHTLANYGLPRLGTAPSSSHRALLQVLPLAFSLAWNPPDPNRLLDFLLLPMSPLRRAAANRLADAVAENPGVGGDAWQAAWNQIDEQMSRDDRWADPQKRAEQLAEWRELVEPERHDPTVGMPRAAARRIAASVKSWAARRFSADEDPLYLTLAQMASELDAAVDVSGLDRLDRLLIERMIEESSDVGAADPGAIAEAAPWRAVSHPGAVWGTAGTIVWWRFADSSEASAEARWNELERADLSAAGYPLDPPDLELKRLAAAWERPLLHASERLLLVLPALAAGVETAIHPLWHSLAARKKGLAQDVSVRAEDIFSRAAPEFAGRRLARAPAPVSREPAARPEWSAPTTAIQPREFESASSLENLLSCPLRWTLQYACGLRPGPRQALPRIEPIIGTIAHKIAEEIFGAGQIPPTNVVESTARRRFEDLLPRIGASLLLPGAAAELTLARHAIPPALAALGQFLAAERLTVVGVESQFEVRDTLAPGTGVKGRIDLRAQTAAGRPVIVDLKWYRTDNYLRQDLKRGMALQIAVYARHVSDERVDAAAGYFALRQQRFLTTAPMPGARTEIIDGPSARETWERASRSFAAAVGDLAAGKVRAPYEEADTKPDKFSDPYLLSPPKCGLCDFTGICGVAR